MFNYEIFDPFKSINLFSTETLILSNFEYNTIELLTIISPLDQFEIRNLFSIETPLLDNMNLSITNIGLYMIIAAFLAFCVSVLANNISKITPNK